MRLRVTSWLSRNPRLVLAALSLSGMGASVLVCEAYLRRQTGNPDASPRAPRFVRLREHLPNQSLTRTPSDEYLQGTDSLVKAPYQLRTDADGFILPAKRHAAPDFTLVFLGGSTTECLYMPEERRFPVRAALLLEERTRLRVNAYNGGVSGDNTLHLIEVLLNKVLRLRPDVVVLGENINDLATLLLLGSYWNDNPSRGAIVVQRPSPWLALATLCDALVPLSCARGRELFARLSDPALQRRTVQDEFREARGRQLDRWPEMEPDFEASLRTFVTICRAWGIEPILMTQASRFVPEPDPVIHRAFEYAYRETGISYPRFREQFLRFNDVVRSVGRGENVAVIDLAAEIPPTRRFLYDAVHYNVEGAERAASAITSWLAPVVLRKRAKTAKASD